MKNVKLVIRDVVKIFIIALITAIVITGVFFLFGIIVGEHNILSGIEVAKNGTLIVSSIGFFLLAGMIISKGKQSAKIQLQDSWKKHFHIIGYKTSVGVISIAFILMATIMDYVQMISIK